MDNSHIPNKINAVVQDKQGYIWLGTDVGLYKFDGSTTKAYLSNSLIETTLSSNFIYDIKLDSRGILWIATGEGLNTLNPIDDSIIRYSHGSFLHNLTVSLSIVSKNNIWLATKGGLCQFSQEKQKFIHSHDSTDSLLNQRMTSIITDLNDDVWVGTESAGLFFFQTKKKTIQHFQSELQQTGISSITTDIKNNLWVGYAIPGLSVYNASLGTFKHISLQKNSIFEDQISTMMTAKNGNIWFGMYNKGVFIKENSDSDSYININSSDINPDGIVSTQITKIYEDNNHNIWLTTTNNGVYFLKHNNLITHTLSKFNSSWNKLIDNDIWSIMEDTKNRLWIGTSQGVQVLSSSNKSSIVFQHDPTNEKSLSDNTVLDIIETKSGDIWLATSRGLNLFEESNNQFKRFFYDKNNPLSSFVIANIHEDKKGNIWVASFNGGLTKIDKNHQYITFKNSEKIDSISDNFVTSITEDKTGKLYVGTRNGLNSFNYLDQTFTRHILPKNSIWSLNYDKNNHHLLIGSSEGLIKLDLKNNETKIFNKRNGGTGEVALAGEFIYCIIQNKQSIIISTEAGISEIDRNDKITNFNVSHGFQHDYNLNACAKGSNEQVFLGGSKGLSLFNKNKIKLSSPKPVSHISSVKIYDNNKSKFIIKNINKDKIELPSSSNNLRIYFSGILFEQKENLKFQYRLIGLNDNWTNQDIQEPNLYSNAIEETIANYTNLDPGSYQFEVKFISNDNVWSEISKISFTITPPWWQTVFAMCFYFLFFLAFVYYIIKWRTAKLTNDRKILEVEVKKRTLELEEMVEKAKQLSLDKTRLLANVSHEFRTPLTLILSPLEVLIKEKNLIEFVPTLSLIKSNAQRLLHLVEQLLTFSQIIRTKKHHKVNYDVYMALNDIIASFRPVIEEKHLSLKLAPYHTINLNLIEGSFETILINILSNAVKFTPPYGEISISIQIDACSTIISIKDSGIGISLTEQSLVFEYFGRSTEAIINNYPGTGIGLALVKELVNANKGTINVNSKVNDGSTFTVRFPLTSINKNNNSITGNVNSHYALNELKNISVDTNTIDTKENSMMLHKESILIIDDNIEMCLFLTSQFKNEYNCYVANNGKIGVSLAEENVPDIIICDVMMPILGGFEVVDILKDNEITCHIPIILLTAKADTESRLEAWKKRADSFIIKPFNLVELKYRVNNLLSIRNMLNKRFSTIANGKTLSNIFNESDVNVKDKKFIESFEQLISANYHSSEFNRSFVANKLAMSERQLNRKLSALIDNNFSEYLRKYRLSQSLKLKNQGLQITQISDLVGFSSSSYFSSCFKAEFGMSYSEWISGGKITNPQIGLSNHHKISINIG